MSCSCSFSHLFVVANRSKFVSAIGVLSFGLVVIMLPIAIFQATDYETDSARANKVAQYNKAVAAWTADGFARFRAAMRDGGLLVKGPDGFLHLLKADFTCPKLKDSMDGVTAYTSCLQYTLSGPLTAPFWQSRLIAPVSIIMNVSSGPIVLGSPNVQFTQTQIENSGSWKDCVYEHQGSFFRENNTCAVYQVRQNLCVQLNNGAGDGSWTLGDVLCPLGTNTWTTQKPANPYSSTPTSIYPDPPMTTIVRSTTDPFLAAVQITDGSLNFGVSKVRRMASAIVLFVNSAIFLTIGTIVGIMICIEAGPYLEGYQDVHAYDALDSKDERTAQPREKAPSAGLSVAVDPPQHLDTLDAPLNTNADTIHEL
eukprot:gnl/Spiro4/8179_TR4310_c0_g3_i1.p1 gnl/Spiro4/8179_TR4310_c0_g3~~gnl/Spiro4/8179_TR4310_c0_g3_i1.p1  ORF type:complete len:368 (-),score=82.97 gnl/Spiro4/8179_TR4310_c0_g3_i1:156-1259(-)